MELPQKIMVKQKVEGLEIITSLETKNKYAITDEPGTQYAYAYEESGFLTRHLFGSHRPMEINVIDPNKNFLFQIERPFFFLKTKADIKTPSDELIASIEQRKWWLTKTFEIYDPQDQLLFTCVSKFPHVWTFDIMQNNQRVAQILKKWSGFGKEMFTDADTFMVDFGNIKDTSIKALILATAFIIDARVFEGKS